MKTGIEKFKNTIDSETCDLLIKYLEDNLHDATDLAYSDAQNVIGKQILLRPIILVSFRIPFDNIIALLVA